MLCLVLPYKFKICAEAQVPELKEKKKGFIILTEAKIGLGFEEKNLKMFHPQLQTRTTSWMQGFKRPGTTNSGSKDTRNVSLPWFL